MTADLVRREETQGHPPYPHPLTHTLTHTHTHTSKHTHTPHTLTHTHTGEHAGACRQGLARPPGHGTPGSQPPPEAGGDRKRLGAARPCHPLTCTSGRGGSDDRFLLFYLLGSWYFVQTDTGADPHGVCVLAARRVRLFATPGL